MIDTILVATDGSDRARKAVDLAGDLAIRYGAKVNVVHVLLPFDAKGLMRPARNENLIQTPGGDPAPAILDHAREVGADMIVLGSRGLGDLKGLVMGSVSHKVACLAPCTCVAVT